MRKPELIDELAKATGLTKQESAGIVETAFECITAALVNGTKVELRGFGSFKVPPAGVARNPPGPVRPHKRRRCARVFRLPGGRLQGGHRKVSARVEDLAGHNARNLRRYSGSKWKSSERQNRRTDRAGRADPFHALVRRPQRT